MFWLWWIITFLMIAADVVWCVIVFHLTKRRLWRALASVFIAGQLAAHISAAAGMDWPRHVPQFVLVAAIIWHFLAVGLAFTVLLPIGIVCAWRRLPLRWAAATRRSSSIATPTRADSLSRREFLGAAAALAPPLFTVSLTGLALAQLNNFRVRRFTLSLPSLPPALDGMTIAHVTDMHVGEVTCGKVLRKMVNTTNALRPDVVVLTGDLIDRDLADLPEALALVKAMEARYGLWMIEGNHDLFENGGEFEQRVKTAGVPLLLDESAVASVRGYPVQFFGLRWMAGAGAKRDRLTAIQLGHVLKQRQPDAFPILMAHHPHAFDAAIQAKLPLTLAGHTHGGQLMLHNKRGVGSAFFRYWSGLYTREDSQMIVSNGVGNWFPIRVNAPAEIVHLTLRSA